MFNYLKNKQMKKVFLFFAVAMVFASCAPKATEEAAVTGDSVVVEEVVDTTAVDTAAVDTTVVAQ
jgi:PBP1b-binding outer membrane lipoprotein LpoB